MTELRGVGIGLGVAQGPVARMAEPLPAPDDTPSARSAADETARVRERVKTTVEETSDKFKELGEGLKKITTWPDVGVWMHSSWDGRQ